MSRLILAYLVVTALFLIDLGFYLSEGISLRGHLFDWLLLWVWIIFTAYTLVVNRRERWALNYFMGLVVITILSMLPMMIPFISLLGYALDYEGARRYRINDTVELAEHTPGPISHPRIIVVRSSGVIEKIVGSTEFDFEVDDNYYQRISEAKGIRQLPSAYDDSLKVELKFEEGVVIRTIYLEED